MRTLLGLVLWIAAIVVIVVGVTLWWYVYRPLPQLEGKVDLPGLQAQVTVERDEWGVPHIRASTLEDAVEAQGYVIAQDRLWQMDLLRRASRGQLSEILGPVTLEVDKDFRTLNFSRAAERDLALMDPSARKVLEAYARGVNNFIREHENRLPIEFTLLHYKPQPWQPTDTLVISGYMYRTLTDRRRSKMNRAVVTAKVGPELARDLYSHVASMDHFVLGDPNVEGAAQSASQADADNSDDDELAIDDVLKASRSEYEAPDAVSAPDLTSLLALQAAKWLERSPDDLRHSLGSNNWVVNGEHTATGKPLLANDTHLELTVPPIWYELHITAPGWNVKGFTLPGAPLVVVGHNDRIAWGFTNNGADVLDLYLETFNPANPDEYRVDGQWRKAEVRDEVLKVMGKPDEHMSEVITRHGPVIKREGEKAYAMRWTALEPGGLANSYYWLGNAQNWDQFREVMKHVWGPAQNAVYADVDGNIGYVMAARVPVRKKGHGELPVPGDAEDYEWTGYIPFEQLPQVLNPEGGLIVTANARVVGPKYKPFLTDDWEEPYRTARIWDLLHDKHDLRPEDMLKVQTDTYSYPHVFMAGQLAAAAQVAPPKDERAKKLIEQAKNWNGIADANSYMVTFLNAALHRSLNLILEAKLGEDASRYQWRRVALLQRILTERPARWLPPTYKSYDELLSAAADQAVKQLEERTKEADPDEWTWKHFNYLDMLHPLGRTGTLKRLLSLSEQPQSGTDWSPRAASRTHGPSERFVANLADWDQSILLVPAGQSGQPGSEHYTDQFPYWFEGKPIYGPFSDAAEAKIRRHTLTLKPAVH
ncbi:MAG TPA: penicillin acylase family protein [Candidatus Acidoferrum sp.]